MKIIYMGTPEFAVAPLSKMYEKGYEILAVITQPDKPRNRGKKVQFTPVKQKAIDLGLPVFQPEKIRGNTDFVDELKKLEPDLIVVAAYGKILPKEIIELPSLGCINIHASLLPKLRGAAPIQRSIIQGFDTTGVTLMQMAEGLDTGPMIEKREVKIGNMNAAALTEKLSEIGADLLLDILPLIESKKIELENQNDSESTYAPMITKAEGLIDFNNGAKSAERLVRGLDPWPSAYVFYKGILVKIREANFIEEIYSNTPGTIINVSKNGIKVAANDGTLLITKVQFPNKNIMTVDDYIRGNDIETGIVLNSQEV